MHVLIPGITGMGKTRLAKALIESYTRECLVLDPIGDPHWPKRARVFRDIREFSRTVRASRCCMVFIDEAPQAIRRYDDEHIWLATQARHLGHLCHFLTVRPQAMNANIRHMCSHVLAFKMSFTDAKLLSDERACRELLLASELAPLEYIYAAPNGDCTRWTIDGKEVKFAPNSSELRERSEPEGLDAE
jgi:hypothetical protein